MTFRRAALFLICVGLATGAFLGVRKVKDHFERVSRMARTPPLDKSLYTRRVDQFMASEAKSRIVMLGDSRVQEADWSELLGRQDVVNRGISGDTTSGLLARLSESVSESTELCIIQIGVNDLIQQSKVADVERNYREIFSRLAERQPPPRVIQMAIILTSDPTRVLNDRIGEANSRLRQMAEEHHADWLDPNEMLAPHGVLEGRWTSDGLHLNGEGYAQLASSLKTRIDRFLSAQ